MSSGSSNLQVKKVLKGIVDKVAREFDDAEPANPTENGLDAGDSEVRRPVRARKQPDRLDTKPVVVVKRMKQQPVKLEIVMDPAPADLRGILKKDFAPFPPPRKSSLSANAGKTILKKYRKVRVSRRLQYKLIPPLPGWRVDRLRMPEEEPDEEEKQRLERAEEAEKEKQEAQRKKRKRKSIGLPVSSTSDDDVTVGTEEATEDADPTAPGSPDVFYEDYMRVNSPDSVLVTDSETEEKREESRRPAPKALFPTIEEEGQQSKVTVASGDTVAADPKKKEKRRSVRIQPPEAEKPKVVRKERRKSMMYPVTPAKEESPVVKKPEEKRARRKSGVIRLAPAPAKKEDEPSTSKKPVFYPHCPYNEEPCESEEVAAAAREHLQKKSESKVAAWLARPDAAAADPYPGRESMLAAAAGGEPPEAKPASTGGGGGGGTEEIETTRGAESRDSPVQLTEEEPSSSGSKKLVEAPKSVQPLQHLQQQKQRKGRRSMMVTKEVKGRGGGVAGVAGGRERGKENEELPSKSSKSEEGGEAKGEEKKKQAHPFFAKFAPKPTVAAERKQPPATLAAGRRRSMFVSKKSLTAKKESSPVDTASGSSKSKGKDGKKKKENGEKKKSPPAEGRKEKKEEEESEGEDAIEIVGEVKKEKEERKREERGATSHKSGEPHSTHAAIWRATEIDAAPYAGLVHVGRDKEDEDGGGKENEGKEGEEGVVRKMRRLSVRLPRLSSYDIPPCLRSPEPAAETVPVFDEEREYDG